MPFLASESTPKKAIVEAARAIIDRQETETWKWYDADLLAFLQDGIVALERVRPASGYIGMRRVPRTPVDIPPVPPVFDIGSDSDSDSDPEWERYVERMNELLAEPILVDGRWHQALVEYVCYEAFRRDESDAASQKLAQQHYQSFVELAQR